MLLKDLIERRGCLMTVDQEPRPSEIQELIDAVRIQKPVLWVGAGFSQCAGLPSSSDLVSAMVEACPSRQHKDYLREHIGNLNQAAQAFESFTNRGRLVETVVAAIQGAKADLRLHKTILDIPQFDTIVTTNYDTLFEQCEPDGRIVVVRGSRGSLVPPEKDQVTLYKAHGCVTQPESMVMTTSDYSRWFDEYEKSPVWAKIYSLLAERPVIFMGFSLADHNVSHLVDRLIRWLPQERVAGFVVDINMPEPRQADLSRYRIKGIRADIRQVLDQIRNEVIRNVLIDTTENLVDPSRATAISSRIGYAPEWLVDNSGIILKSIEPLDAHKLTVKFTLQYKEDDFSRLTDYFKRGSDVEFVIPADNIKGIRLMAGEMELPPRYEPGQISLAISSPKSEEFDTTLFAVSDSSLAIPVHVQAYPGEVESMLKIEHGAFVIRIYMKRGEHTVTVGFEGKKCYDPHIARAGMAVLMEYLQGTRVCFRYPKMEQLVPLPQMSAHDSRIDGYRNDVKRFHELCSQLVDIESNYGVKLRVPDSVEDDEEDLLYMAFRSAHGKKIRVGHFGAKLLLRTLGYIGIEGVRKPSTIKVIGSQPETITLFGARITLGYPIIEAYDAVFDEPDKIEEALREGVDRLEVRICSLSNQLFLHYVPEPYENASAGPG